MAEKIIFKNSLLIDGQGGDPVPDATLVVSGSRIEAVLPEGVGRSAPRGKVIDLKGKTLMPGLIVLDENPLDDLTIFEYGLERVVLVMKEGRIMKNNI